MPSSSTNHSAENRRSQEPVHQLAEQLAIVKPMVVGRGWGAEQGGEYPLMFGLKAEDLTGKVIYDVAGGVASFVAEACKLGAQAFALDSLYQFSSSDLRESGSQQLQSFQKNHPGVQFEDPKGVKPSWLVPLPSELVNTQPKMLSARQNSLRLFIDHYEGNASRYISYALPDNGGAGFPPALPKADLILLGNCLMAYAGRPEFTLSFHLASITKLAQNLAPEGKIQIYPFGEVSEAFGYDPKTGRGFKVEEFLDQLSGLGFRYNIVRSDYAFVKNWTHYLEIRNRP